MVMNKLSSFLVLFIVCSSSCLKLSLAARQLNDFAFEFGDDDVVAAPQPSAPVPAVPTIVSCLKDIHIEETCIHDIIVSYFTHKLHLEPECCATVSAITEDCVAPVFAYFKSPFFGILLKEHCASELPGLEHYPPAPAPAPGSDDSIFSPAPESGDSSPAPAPESGDSSPAPAPESGDSSPAPAPESGDSSPAPAPESGDSSPAPAPESGDSSPAPAPESGDSSPAPAPESDESSPAPAPESDESSPAPAPEYDESSPAPAPESDESSPAQSPEPEGGC